MEESNVFDFLKGRAQEGLDQVKNIAEKTAQGRLSKALQETADYLGERRSADGQNFAKFAEGLAASRELLLGATGVFGNVKGVSEMQAALDELEELLIGSDIGVDTTDLIIEELKLSSAGEALPASRVKQAIRNNLILALGGSPDGSDPDSIGLTAAAPGQGPTVLFIIGANGMGKTTTVGKLSARLKAENKTVLLAACDTFRAAAVDQLNTWADRAEVEIELGVKGEKPVAVLQRSITRAMEQNFDTLIVDTSGRLHNNLDLVEELVEMKEMLEEMGSGSPHETLLVVDAAVGRNAVKQAQSWRREVGVSGLAVTKLDGSSKGGFVVSVTKELGMPVKLVGVGEGINDLRDFDPVLYVDALLGITPTEAAEMNEALKDASQETVMRQQRQVQQQMMERQRQMAGRQTVGAGARSATKKKKRKGKKK